MITSPGAWQAIHIHYTSDSSPLLTECVAPLVRQLRERGLITRYFFINYWLEGPHVRLRLLPASQDVTAEICQLADRAIMEFLARRPALYEFESEFLLGFYDEMFRLEYTEEERLARYGSDGTMPLQDNNSYVRVAYEPEYRKYGGPAAVGLAEWHFEHSSDLVLDLLANANVHLRTVRLGLSMQLMAIMCATFLRTGARMAEFIERYYAYWRDSFKTVEIGRTDRYDGMYAEMEQGLRERVREIHERIASGQLNQLTGFSGGWAAHCEQLRDGVLALAAQEKLVFPTWDGFGSEAVVTDPDRALQLLLSPYVHMTNNRLGVNIIDEAYLSYVLLRALSDEFEFTMTIAADQS